MQPTIQLYLDQHARALQCAKDITAKLDTNDVGTQANEVRFLLAHLAGVLKPHLTSEDRLLYPSLINSDVAGVSQTAKRFWEEMGGISAAVDGFLNQWRKPGEIEKGPEKFKTECAAIFAALASRIEKEERELYPLFLANH